MNYQKIFIIYSTISLFSVPIEASQENKMPELCQALGITEDGMESFKNINGKPFPAFLSLVQDHHKKHGFSHDVLPQYREDFISLINLHKTSISGYDCGLMLILYMREKKNHIMFPGAKSLFTDESTFEKILPILIERQEVLPKPTTTLFFIAHSDPKLINRLIYIHNQFPCTAKGSDVFSALFSTILKEGFILNNKLLVFNGEENKQYKETLNKTVFEQTEMDRIEYIKSCLRPPQAIDYSFEQFPKELKNKLFTFLLCTKDISKKIMFKVPKQVMHTCIINRLKTYGMTRPYKTLFMDGLDSLKVIADTLPKNGMLSFLCDDFEKWFDGFE